MRCEQVKALLDAYADGELTVGETRKIAAHLRTCPTCQREWERVQRLRNWLDDAFTAFRPKPSPSLRQRLERALVKARPTARRQVTTRQATKVALFALPVLMLLALLSLRFNLSNRLPERASVITAPIALQPPTPKPPSAIKPLSIPQATTQPQHLDIVLPSASQTTDTPRRTNFVPQRPQRIAQPRLPSRLPVLTASASAMLTHQQRRPLRPASFTPKRAVDAPLSSPAFIPSERMPQSPFPSFPTELPSSPDEPVVLRLMQMTSPESASSAWAYQVLSAPNEATMVRVIPQGVVAEPVAIITWRSAATPLCQP
jgi:hypothetical protein